MRTRGAREQRVARAARLPGKCLSAGTAGLGKAGPGMERFAYVPSLPGCTSSGRTRGGALETIKQAIQLALECRKEHGLDNPAGRESLAELAVQVPPLPRRKASEWRRTLHRLGFVGDRQRGSRLMRRYRDDPGRYALLPVHSRGVIPPGRLHPILRTAQIRPEDLSEQTSQRSRAAEPSCVSTAREPPGVRLSSESSPGASSPTAADGEPLSGPTVHQPPTRPAPPRPPPSRSAPAGGWPRPRRPRRRPRP